MSALVDTNVLVYRYDARFPDEQGAATDAHLWAYAEAYGLDEILSEDFQHGRQYGSVRIRNPFLTAE
ncbi:hypothetical protein BH24PSE2_BH24PSE2_00030 [soil metagenome]